jgi:hypothetical protein
MNSKFSLGQLAATPGALAAANQSGDNLASFIRRHVQGDWGDLCADDVQENEFSLENGLRLLSSYRLKDGTKIFWIITEADRSVTTVLLPEEY